ncbi:MAG: MarR family transcriptional regulator [Cyclobacteriaceae bacterium]|nr:MarR family transcriptional regulator [Cyclobacteriaceae bacterium HetDA_MAG_MS6]
MGIEEEIKQRKFKSHFNKAIINLIYTNGWINQQQIRLFKPHDLTTPQFNVLRILRGQYPNPSTINLLIDRMLDKNSNASRIVDKLEKKKLVVRKQCPADRRAVDVFISDTGLALLEKIDLELDLWDDEMRRLTEEECILLNELLDKIREGPIIPGDIQ